MDVLTVVMQSILPSESHIRVKTLDVIETPMMSARTFTGALTALREWHYPLRITEETLHAQPEPSRAWTALKALTQHLVTTVREFVLEWGKCCGPSGWGKEPPLRR